MAKVFDVAAFILDKEKSLSTMKLQKLVFYSQAYHLVTVGQPLFAEPIEAWANGPVVRALFNRHRREFVISAGFFGNHDPSVRLKEAEQESILHTIKVLGAKSGAELSALTHQEEPWRTARGNLDPTQPSQEVITLASIRRYYGSPQCANPLFAL